MLCAQRRPMQSREVSSKAWTWTWRCPTERQSPEQDSRGSTTHVRPVAVPPAPVCAVSLLSIDDKIQHSPTCSAGPTEQEEKWAVACGLSNQGWEPAEVTKKQTKYVQTRNRQHPRPTLLHNCYASAAPTAYVAIDTDIALARSVDLCLACS